MSISSRRRLLFIGTLPEPTTGQSLACQVLLDDLRSIYDVKVVDLAKSTIDKSTRSARRIREVFAIGMQTARGVRGADVIYITIAESVLGNIRDLLLYMLCAGRLKKTVIHLHGGAGMWELLSDHHRILRRFNKFFLRRLGAVIVLGDRLTPLYEAYVEPERLVVVPNFATDDLFVGEHQVQVKFDDTKPLRLLFLSNLIEGKGWRELLTAYESLSPNEQNQIELHLAGTIADERDEGPLGERLEVLAHAYYHGSVRGEAKAALLAKSHVFCLPTYYAFEGQPISILEAYAAGCVVITTDHSGIFDIFEPGINGFEVAPRSPDSVRHAITCLLDRTDLAQIGLHNNREARSRYRADQYCANVRQVLDMVVA
jgi:glycosyltransferase involved in cell wall biosynthesis